MKQGVVSRLHFCRQQYMRSSAIFQTVLAESQNTQTDDMPIARQTLMRLFTDSLYLLNSLGLLL